MFISNDRSKRGRLGLYLIIAFIGISVAFLLYSSVGLNNMSGALVADEGFAVDGTLDLASLNLKLPGNRLEMVLGKSSGTLSIDNLDLELVEGTSIMLLDYKGSLKFDNILELDGCAPSIFVNSMVIAKNGKCLDVDILSEFESVKVADLNIKSLKFKSTGRIDAASKGSFTVNDEEVEIEPFNGNIDMLSKQLSLQGFTKSLSIAGAPRVTID